MIFLAGKMLTKHRRIYREELQMCVWLGVWDKNQTYLQVRWVRDWTHLGWLEVSRTHHSHPRCVQSRTHRTCKYVCYKASCTRRKTQMSFPDKWAHKSVNQTRVQNTNKYCTVLSNMQKAQIDHVQGMRKQRKRLDRRSYELWTNINGWTNIPVQRAENAKHYISNNYTKSTNWSCTRKAKNNENAWTDGHIWIMNKYKRMNKYTCPKTMGRKNAKH